MSIVVPVNRGTQDDALDVAINICREKDEALIALLRRPVSEFDQDSVDREIDELNDRLDSANITFSIEIRLGDEDLATHISQIIIEKKARLVVVSLAKRPINGRLTLGSQIQKLLLESPCPVLVVRETRSLHPTE